MSLTLDRQWFYIRVSGYYQGYGKGQQCPPQKKKRDTRGGKTQYQESIEDREYNYNSLCMSSIHIVLI